MEHVYINENYRLSTDAHNVILERRHPGGHEITHGKYKGQIAKDSWEAKFFPTFSRALKHLLLEECHEVGELGEVAEKIEAAMNSIKNLPFGDLCGRCSAKLEKSG